MWKEFGRNSEGRYSETEGIQKERQNLRGIWEEFERNLELRRKEFRRKERIQDFREDSGRNSRRKEFSKEGKNSGFPGGFRREFSKEGIQ